MQTQIDIETLRKARRAASRASDLHAAEAYLNRRGIRTFGIELLHDTVGVAKYINLGDTYDTTVVRANGRFMVCSWGAWFESQEQKHNRENRTIRCGYCSHITPKNRRDWHSVICESCGHHVDGSR